MRAKQQRGGLRCPVHVNVKKKRDGGEGRETLSILFSSRICVKVFAEEGEAGGASAVDIVDELVRGAGGKAN